MFDNTMHGQDVLDISEQAEDLICEIMAARDELTGLRAGQTRRETSEWEVCELKTEYELFTQHCHEELARLRFEMQWGIEAEPNFDLDVVRDPGSFSDFEVGPLGEKEMPFDIAC